MYTKLLSLSLSFTAITSYAMLPGRTLMSKLVTDAIRSQAAKSASPLSMHEKAAAIQTALKESKQKIQISPEVVEEMQMQTSAAAWFLGLPERKAPSNRYITKKIKSKSCKRV